MSEKKCAVERFDSIFQMLETINARAQNPSMSGEDYSQRKNDKSWYGTESYEEAVKVFREGYTDILDRVRKGVKEAEKLVKVQYGKVEKMRPKNHIVGFIPNVPNALLNIPESMITLDRHVQKQKAVDIYYVMSGNCGTDANVWVKAGIALLSAIKMIELLGVSVKLEVSFFCANTNNGDESLSASVNVKNYKDRLDLQKLCFPIAHPSMFRRFGFKWLETTKEKISGSWAWGYGSEIPNYTSEVPKRFHLGEHTYCLSAQWIKDHNYDPIEIIKYINNGNKIL